MNPASSSKPHHPKFSLSRIWAVATNTATQLVRMKILIFLLVLSVIIVGAGFAFPVMNPEQQLKLLKYVSLGALQLFSMVMAITATALLIPRDLEDRTLYTILSKPVPRHEYLIGKLLGVLLLLAGGLLVMDLFFSGVVWLKQQLIISSQIASLQAEQGDTPENIAFIHNVIGQYGLTWNLHAGVFSIFLKSAVIASMALLISCFASSTIFTIVVTLGFTIAGFGQQLIRDWFLKGLSVTVEKGIALFLTLICPDLSLFDLVEASIRGDAIPLGTLGYISGIALLYVVGYTAVAHMFFVDKEL